MLRDIYFILDRTCRVCTSTSLVWLCWPSIQKWTRQKVWEERNIQREEIQGANTHTHNADTADTLDGCT